MPCYVTGSAEGDANLRAENARNLATELTDLLCETCKYMDKTGVPLPNRTAKWWSKHQKIDSRRKRDEELDRDLKRTAASARKKLNAKEISALGL
jgi:hypothetical protein